MCEPNAQNNKHLDNNNSYITVNETRKRKNQSVNDHMMAKIKNNYYAILDSETENCDEDVIKKFERQVLLNSVNKNIEQQKNKNDKPTTPASLNRTDPTNNTCENNNTENNNNSVKNKNTNIPPINVYEIQSKKITELLKDGLKITKLKIKEYNQNKRAILLSNLDDYIRVRSHLEKAKAKFYSYTPKCLKQQQIVKVSPFTTKNSLQRNIAPPMFMVLISAESSVHELKAIDNIQYHKIKWESLRRPEIPQCRNFQNFFHSASNCHLPPSKQLNLLQNQIDAQRKRLDVICNLVETA
ncbi:unnamed protein product [Ceratitis capitata]|uniref:(Mediterranean fruit fly) hypothetical protein n=1 Tax=Ceratitis capitata TaxID=7213 RepID=A0A811VK37_CERCA|nr:unnamed protein product [Ceratitis capitata]